MRPWPRADMNWEHAGIVSYGTQNGRKLPFCPVHLQRFHTDHAKSFFDAILDLPVRNCSVTLDEHSSDPHG
jgi:hypothetical protein